MPVMELNGYLVTQIEGVNLCVNEYTTLWASRITSGTKRRELSLTEGTMISKNSLVSGIAKTDWPLQEAVLMLTMLNCLQKVGSCGMFLPLSHTLSCPT